MQPVHHLNPILTWCGAVSGLGPTYLLLHSGNMSLASMGKMIFLFTHPCPVLIGTKALEKENTEEKYHEVVL